MIVCFVIEIMMVMMGDRGSEKGDVVTKKINDVKQNPHRSISNSTFSKTKSFPNFHCRILLESPSSLFIPPK